VNSLSAHLTAGADHGRLRFHPDCPFCRSQRLAGTLGDTLLSARAQAGLLAAALGASSLLPTSVAAASDAGKPPAAKGGQAPLAPPAPASDEPSTGSDETQEAPIDEAPQVRELLTSPEAGTDTYGEDIGGADEDAEPAPPGPLGEQPVDPAPVEPAPVQPAPIEPLPAAPPSPPTAAPQPAPAAVEPRPAAEQGQAKTRPPADPPTKRTARERPSEPREAEPRLVIGSQPAPPQLSPTPVGQRAATPATPTTVPVSRPTEPADGPVRGPSYTVRPGDSLWSIARRLLSGSPSAGQIAREVERLWHLNGERIGTGNPSLIYPGTVLRLR
jgi:LysM domain